MPWTSSSQGLGDADQARYGAAALRQGPTFKKAADQFLAEYETITDGQRSPQWVPIK